MDPDEQDDRDEAGDGTGDALPQAIRPPEDEEEQAKVQDQRGQLVVPRDAGEERGEDAGVDRVRPGTRLERLVGDTKVAVAVHHVEQPAVADGEAEPLAPDQALRCVFTVLNRHVPKGQIDKVRGALPQDLRELWPEGDGQAAAGEEPKRKATRGM